MSKVFSSIGYGVVLAMVIFLGAQTETFLRAQNQESATPAVAVTPKRSASLDPRIDKIAHRIGAVEVGEGQPPVALDLEQLMKLYQMAALSVAVIDDYQNALAKAYGVTEP